MPPQGRRVVTIGVDLQDMELVGFGLSDESWSLDYRVLYGDPSGQELWGEPGVTRLVRERVQHESARRLRIRAACIDSGGHHHTVAIYNCVRDKQARSI